MLDHVFGANPVHSQECRDYELYQIAQRTNCRTPQETIKSTAKHLDEVAAGRASKKHTELSRSLIFHTDTASSSMSWWIRVLYDVVHSRPEHVVPERLYTEMNAVYSCFSEVQRGHLQYKDYGDRACLEYLKRYRIFTRSVCALAKEAWPDENLQGLLDQV